MAEKGRMPRKRLCGDQNLVDRCESGDINRGDSVTKRRWRKRRDVLQFLKDGLAIVCKRKQTTLHRGLAEDTNGAQVEEGKQKYVLSCVFTFWKLGARIGLRFRVALSEDKMKSCLLRLHFTTLWTQKKPGFSSDKQEKINIIEGMIKDTCTNAVYFTEPWRELPYAQRKKEIR